jgi:hypothetical protein
VIAAPIPDTSLYLPLQGGTMTGPLVLASDPTATNQAATKNYVDLHSGGITDVPSDSTTYGRSNAAWVHVLPLTGGTLTGMLTLSTAPTVALHAATKAYVDGKAWQEAPTDGYTYGRAKIAWSQVLPLQGGTLTGALILNADPTTALGAVTKQYSDTKAPLASPAFTGNPTAPTQAVDDNSTKLATTAYVTNQLSASGDGTPAMDGTAARGVSTHGARADHVHPTDTSRAPLASPTFTGTPAAPTPTAGDNSTKIATTAFVAAGFLSGNQTITLSGDVTGSGATAITTTLATVNSNVGTFQGLTVNAKGLVTGASNMNYATTAAVAASYAPLASPALTGTPTAPTAPLDTNTTQLATTAFVLGQLSVTADGVPAMDGTAARGVSTHGARADHVHPTDTSRAPLASPAFTGTPTAPTPTTGDNSTNIATTAFVAATASGGSGFPSGTVMPFIQAAAPTGWTRITTYDDCLLRIVGTATPSSGGATAFSSYNAVTATAAFTLTTATAPAHQHGTPYRYYSPDTTNNGPFATPSSTAAWGFYNATSNDGGSGGSHTHGVTRNIKYVDALIASKN